MANPSRGSARTPEAHHTPGPTQGIYDRLSPAYDAMADASEHEAREAGLTLLAPAPGERLLEIGCGTGRALGTLAQAAGAGGRVVGLDLSGGMLDVARRRLEDEPAARAIDLVQADGSRLPFPAAVFDAVFLSFTLEMFPAWAIPSVLEGIARALRPDGRLAVVSLLRTRPAPLALRVYDWFHHRFPHFVDCQPIDLPDLLRRGGFAVTRTRELHICGLPVMAAAARKG